MDVETLNVDAEESAMRELGQETDAAQGREPTPSAETPEPRAPESPEPETPEPQAPEAEQPEQAPDVTEQLTPEQKLGRDVKTGQFKKAEKPETEYSKAQKEEIRKDRTWRQIQAEKEQIRQDKAQWEEHVRMQQLEAARQNYQPLKKEGLTAQEYAEGARRFEQEGDFENAYKAHQVALQLQQQEHQRGEQMRGVEAEYSWRKGMEEVSRAYPGIWDPNDPIVPHLERIISQNPWIYYIPQGFQRAAEVAHMLVQQGSLKEKDDEIIKLRAELEKYQRKSQPSKGGFASPRLGDKDFDEMDLNEQEAHLKHLTAEADSWR